MTPDPDAARGDDGDPEPGGETEKPERSEQSGARDTPSTGDEAAAEGRTEQAPDGPAWPEPALPADEEAAWAAIVAGYGREPDAGSSATDDSGPASPAGGDIGPATGPEGTGLTRPVGEPDGRDGDTPVRSFTVFSAGAGPRDSHSEDDDEGHFVPPDPPPLPETDPTTRFAWLAALGGPLLLFACILTGTAMTWWLYTLGIGGFLGGFATLVARMRDDDEDDGDDPGRGAVV